MRNVRIPANSLSAFHNYVFEVVGKQFWNSLAQLVSWKERAKAREVHRRNLHKPPAKRQRPREFVPASRDPNESSDTVDSDGRDSLGPQHIVRSSKIDVLSQYYALTATTMD